MVKITTSPARPVSGSASFSPNTGPVYMGGTEYFISQVKSLSLVKYAWDINTGVTTSGGKIIGWRDYISGVNAVREWSNGPALIVDSDGLLTADFSALNTLVANIPDFILDDNVTVFLCANGKSGQAQTASIFNGTDGSAKNYCIQQSGQNAVHSNNGAYSNNAGSAGGRDAFGTGDGVFRVIYNTKFDRGDGTHIIDVRTEASGSTEAGAPANPFTNANYIGLGGTGLQSSTGQSAPACKIRGLIITKGIHFNQPQLAVGGGSFNDELAPTICSLMGDLYNAPDVAFS